MDSKIRSVETIPVRVDLPVEYRGSHYRMARRCTIITRVMLYGGVVGESYNADEDLTQPEILKIIHEELAPIVEGMDALRHETCWQAMYAITRDQLRNRRLAVQAIACLDSAIWDAIGKCLGVPLRVLWGGAQDTLPVIGIGGYYTSPDVTTIEDDVAFFAEAGLAGMKFKVGALSPAEDAERLRRAVVAAPKTFRFAADANQGWDVDDAVEFADRVSDFVRLLWFEEPCMWPGDRRSMRGVRLRAKVPVAGGQSEFTSAGVGQLIADDAIDVSNFDASWGGGPTEWRRAASIAHVAGVKMAHHEEPHLASHLLSSVPHGTYLEVFHPKRDPIYWRMLESRPEVQNGRVELSDDPGLGLRLDEAFIKKFKAD